MPLYYHGMDRATALRLLAGEPLAVPQAVARKIDGQLGCYLASDVRDALCFAARRTPASLLQYEISRAAWAELSAAGCVVRPIPLGGMAIFFGTELFVPPAAFAVINKLLGRGEIIVAPSP